MDLVNRKLMKKGHSISNVIGGEEEDRISSLPDSLIYHILSFLDNFKWVARTSLLSKRWSHIWTSIPFLDFRLSPYNPPVSPEIINYIDFVDRTLFLHNDLSNIKKFSLRWFWRSNQMTARKMNSWISTIIKHNVVERISLLLYQPLPNSIPVALFTCESLVTLKLNVSDICFPKYISLPRLKRLKLCNFVFNGEGSNDQIFSSCPVLEDLNLKYCTFSMKIFCISIPTLKFLKLSTTYEVEDCLQDCSLKIHAPGLLSLLCQSNVPKEIILSTPALVEAEVAVLLNDCYVPTTEQKIGDAETISGFLRALTHVTRLSVSERTLQLLFFADKKLKNLPTFHNVKQLTITEEVDSHELLIAVLKATPNLESLIFDNLVTTSYPARKVDMVNTGCLFSHLKFICFRQFIGKPREMKWVKLILKNAKHLQTLSISYGAESAVDMDDRKSKEELKVEVPNIPRASSSCLFKFSSFFYSFV